MGLIDLVDLKAIMPHARQRGETFFEPLNDAMMEFEIDTVDRIAAFLAQVAHESGELRYVRELASGEAYEGRLDLGNTQPGDGPRYRGRGLLQVTGRANYGACSRALFHDEKVLLNEPELLELPVHASYSAAWFWDSRGLNDLADEGAFRLITKRINGGLNGFDARLRYYQRALDVLR